MGNERKCGTCTSLMYLTGEREVDGNYERNITSRSMLDRKVFGIKEIRRK